MSVIDKTTAAVVVMIALLFSFSCKESKMRAAKKPATSSELLPGDSLSRLSQKTVYFGHQSVGANILEGIRDILKAEPQQLWTIVESREPGTVKAPALVHSWVGRNGLPVSKLDDFSDILR